MARFTLDDKFWRWNLASLVISFLCRVPHLATPHVWFSAKPERASPVLCAGGEHVGGGVVDAFLQAAALCSPRPQTQRPHRCAVLGLGPGPGPLVPFTRRRLRSPCPPLRASASPSSSPAAHLSPRPPLLYRSGSGSNSGANSCHKPVDCDRHTCFACIGDLIDRPPK